MMENSRARKKASRPYCFMKNPGPAQTTVTIIIVTWNSAREIVDCLRPIMNLPENWEIWISDNDSRDETVNLVKEKFPRVFVLENGENLGFAKGCNRVIERVNSDFILLLNPDTAPETAELIEVLRSAQAVDNLGAYGVKTISPDGSLQPSCFAFPSVTTTALDSLGLYRFFRREWLADVLFDEFFDHQTSKRVDWLAGCFVLVPTQLAREIGGVPEDYFLFGEDIDLCYRLRQAGYDIIFNPVYAIIHRGNQSAGRLGNEWRIERTLLSKYAFCFKYYGLLRTRVIQLCDLCGYFWAGRWLAWRRPGLPLIEEWGIYRRYVTKALRMSRRELFELLNQPPVQELDR